MRKKLIVIAGPTAVGKTSFAISLAEHYKSEILSADSRQFYREMSIGTAKPTPEELASVPHHFINSLSITDSYNAAQYGRDVLDLLEVLFQRLDLVVLVGGSGLFINSVLTGFDELPAAPQYIRDELANLLQDKGIDHLRELLKKNDPEYYSVVDLNNPQRIIRALEVFQASGQKFSAFRIKRKLNRPFDISVYGLNTERSELYNRINNRVHSMVEAGLVDEVRSLLPYRHLNALNTVGYSELFDYFDKKHSFERAIELIQQNSRRFAKRQITWFNKTEGIQWIDPSDIDRVITDVR